MVARDDIEGRGAQHPPRLRDETVREKALVKDVVILQPFGPSALKIIWILCSEQSRSSLNPRGSRSADRVEFAGFGSSMLYSALSQSSFSPRRKCSKWTCPRASTSPVSEL